MNVKQWHGSDPELWRLREAIQRNCTCSSGKAPQRTCPAHEMLTNQSTLDRLLYVYRARDGFMSKEFARGE